MRVAAWALAVALFCDGADAFIVGYCDDVDRDTRFYAQPVRPLSSVHSVRLRACAVSAECRLLSRDCAAHHTWRDRPGEAVCSCNLVFIRSNMPAGRARCSPLLLFP